MVAMSQQPKVHVPRKTKELASTAETSGSARVRTAETSRIAAARRRLSRAIIFDPGKNTRPGETDRHAPLLRTRDGCEAAHVREGSGWEPLRKRRGGKKSSGCDWQGRQVQSING